MEKRAEIKTFSAINMKSLHFIHTINVSRIIMFEAYDIFLFINVTEKDWHLDSTDLGTLSETLT